jgi:hypothetical protein
MVMCQFLQVPQTRLDPQNARIFDSRFLIGDHISGTLIQGLAYKFIAIKIWSF